MLCCAVLFEKANDVEDCCGSGKQQVPSTKDGQSTLVCPKIVNGNCDSNLPHKINPREGK